MIWTKLDQKIKNLKNLNFRLLSFLKFNKHFKTLVFSKPFSSTGIAVNRNRGPIVGLQSLTVGYINNLHSLLVYRSVFSTFSLKRNPLQQFWLLTELMGVARNLSRGNREIWGRKRFDSWKGGSKLKGLEECCNPGGVRSRAPTALGALRAQKTCLVAANVV